MGCGITDTIEGIVIRIGIVPSNGWLTVSLSSGGTATAMGWMKQGRSNHTYGILNLPIRACTCITTCPIIGHRA